MAVLHIFNPEHDIALAANLSNFTAPHAGRQLRHDLGYLPAVWAAPEDYVLVDDVEVAKKAFSRLMHRQYSHFIDKHQLSTLSAQFSTVSPWGWDLALRSLLLRCGVCAVPSEEDVAVIRDLSHRKQAVALLRELQLPGTIGSSACADTIPEVRKALDNFGHIVVKAPWSSSGRGVRFVKQTLDDYQERWMKNVIEKQQCVVVEPYYNKVKDFGMEFESDGNGSVRYLGLSLFHTKNGAYTGNLIASEQEKMKLLSDYIPESLITTVQEKICAFMGGLLQGKYQGPFGVDMMVVAKEDRTGFLLHPCVEINLRRTMGHVALAIPPFADGFTRVMHVAFTDKYRLSVRKR